MQEEQKRRHERVKLKTDCKMDVDKQTGGCYVSAVRVGQART